MMGSPNPLRYRDVRDEAERCICDLTAAAVENLIVMLDDLFLEWASRDGRRERRG